MKSKSTAKIKVGTAEAKALVPAKRRGVPAKPIIEFPESLTDTWADPTEFREALVLHMDRHGDSV